MYEVQSGQYLKRISGGGVFTYPEYTAFPGLTFAIGIDNSVTVIGSVTHQAYKNLIDQPHPDYYLLADTGDETSQIRRIEKFQARGGIMTISAPFDLTEGDTYDLKMLPAFKETPKSIEVSIYGDSEYQVAINGQYIPIRDKHTFPVRKELHPYVMYSSGDYMITESFVQYNNLTRSIFRTRPGYTYFRYYNSSDPSIAGSSAKHKVFDILAGKTIDDFAVVFIGSFYVQRVDDAPTANEVIGIAADGEVEFKNNQPSKGVYLIFVNI